MRFCLSYSFAPACAAVLFIVSTIAQAGGGDRLTQGYRDERFRAPSPYEGPDRSGEQIYAAYCKTCHGRSTQGAPMPGDQVEWRLRLRQGMDVLMDHTIHGYGQLLMPPRGGCETCRVGELRAAVRYMLEASRIHVAGEGGGAD